MASAYRRTNSGSRLIQSFFYFLSLAWECVIVVAVVVFIRISALSENGLLEKMKICDGGKCRQTEFQFLYESREMSFINGSKSGSDIRRGSIIAFCWSGVVATFGHFKKI